MGEQPLDVGDLLGEVCHDGEVLKAEVLGQRLDQITFELNNNITSQL